jgi:cell division protein FtsB
MRIRQSIAQSFVVLALPAVAVSVVIYFGINGVFGPNGIMAFETTNARLALAETELLQMEDYRQQLSRHVALMERPGGDPDLIEELARNVLMDGAPHQVAISRSAP